MNIRDLARQANVSIATISLVLNNKEGVGPETRQRVLELVGRSGYVPRPPRTVRQKKQRTIRLIKMRDSGLMMDRNEEFIARLIDGVIQAANDADFELVMSNMDISTASTSFADVCGAQDTGLIILASEMPPGMSAILRNLPAPHIVLDNELHQQNSNAVTMNNEQAAYLVANHLYGLGHRRIGFVTSHKPAANHIARERGLVQAGEELGFAYDKKYRLLFTPGLEGPADRTLLRMVARPDFPTAFFAANDILALAALGMFKRIGKRVPDDYSLAGMDNLRACAVSSPQLTSVKLPNETMGRMAVMRLVSHLENPREAPMKTLVGCDLVIRKSTAPPKQRPVDEARGKAQPAAASSRA